MLSSLSDYTQANIIDDMITNIEGGYVDDPSDSGGATNMGITQAEANKHAAYLKATYGWDGTMQNLTQPMATYCYVQDYWNAMSLDGVLAADTYTPLLADLLFEAGVNLGTSTVSQYFQQSLNVLNNQGALYSDITVDGNLGPGSVKALQSLVQAIPSTGLPNLLFMVSALIGARYISIALGNASQERFESGWENRARGKYNSYVPLLSN